MKTKKLLTTAIFYAAIILTGCGTKDEFDTPGAKDALSMDEATKIAWEDAKVSESELENLHARLNDGAEYTVTFTTDQKSYEYCIAASDGMILEKNVNQLTSDTPSPTVAEEQISPTPSSTAPTQTAEISQEEALAIAKKDAGVSDKEIFNLEVKLDKEDGIRVYEIEFDTTEMEYEYDIAVSDGRIINREAEVKDHISANAPVASTSKPSTEITQDTALSFAAKDAGISESEIFNLKIKLDYDDGIHVYEIEFDAGIYEYQYKIAALDGTILEKEMEESDDLLSSGGKNQGAADKITREDALAIARADAGILDGELLDLEIELDDDDGIWYYNIEFCCDGCEYEYEIGTLDGKIWKIEHDDCDHSWHHFDNSHHGHDHH